MIVDSPRHGKARINGAGTITDCLSDRAVLALFRRYLGSVEVGIRGTLFDLNQSPVSNTQCRGADTSQTIAQPQ